MAYPQLTSGYHICSAKQMNHCYMADLAVSKKSVKRWMVLFLFLTSAILTFLLMTNIEQFYVVNQQLLKDPDFVQADIYWKYNTKDASVVSYSGDSINIENSRQTSGSVVQRLSVNSPLFLRLSVDVGVKEIVTDNRDYGGGGISIVLRGKDGSRLRSIGEVINKPMPIRTYTNIIYVDRAVARVDVAFRLLRAEGIFTVRDPELSVLAEFSSYKITQKVLTALWCFLGVWLICWAVRNLQLSSTLVLAGGLSALVVVGVLLPGGIITEFSRSFFSALPDEIVIGFGQLLNFFFGSVDPEPPSASLSNFAHFLLFFLVGALAGWGFRKFGVLYGLALVVVFAVVTEALQTLVFGRSASLHDVYIDSIGGILGLLFVISIILIVEKLAPGERQHSSKQKNQSNLEI